MSSKIIPIEQAIEMKNEYKTHINPLIEKFRGNSYKATDFAWLDLAALKEYVALLEEVQSKNNKTISGVRIYFSAYPNDATFKSTGANVKFPAQESFFMVPTIKVASTPLSSQHPNLENLPFCINPKTSTDFLVGDFEVIGDLLNSKDNTSSTAVTNYTNKTSLVMNDLQLTPPPK
jgi:hypothetical protein